MNFSDPIHVAALAGAVCPALAFLFMVGVTGLLGAICFLSPAHSNIHEVSGGLSIVAGVITIIALVITCVNLYPLIPILVTGSPVP